MLITAMPLRIPDSAEHLEGPNKNLPGIFNSDAPTLDYLRL